jgi:hypothetical protein
MTKARVHHPGHTHDLHEGFSHRGYLKYNNFHQCIVLTGVSRYAQLRKQQLRHRQYRVSPERRRSGISA